MSLVISKVFTYDEDAATYIQAVETADAQALEPATRKAINNFVIGCKQDGIWTAIKASCILSGARTLAGALVPLVGTAPTNVGPFVSGDYDRKTGLVGNGSTKYLDSNRLANSDPANNMSLTAWISSIGAISGNVRYAGAYSGPSTADDFLSSNGDLRCRSVDTVSNLILSNGSLVGMSRTNQTTFTARGGGSNVSGLTSNSTTPGSFNYFIFASNENGTPFGRSSARLAFYSIGESLDLARLDARVTDLITAFGVTIP